MARDVAGIAADLEMIQTEANRQLSRLIHLWC